MSESESRPALVVGELAEYLAVSAGKSNGMPVAILTFRLRSNSPRPLNLMVSRAQLERLREDIDFLLERSTCLKDGHSLEVSLVEVEAIHESLG